MSLFMSNRETTATPSGASAPEGWTLLRSKAIFVLLAALVAFLGVATLGAAQASASSAPIVIPYEKTCDETGHCVGTAGDGGTIEMQGTSFATTGKRAQITVTVWITVGDISFTAELTGHVSTTGEVIVLNGTVTDGSFAGARVHQRSELVGIDGTTTSWTGELRISASS